MSDMTKTLCPECGTKGSVEEVSAQEEVVVRGESISVEARYWHCTSCKVEFENLENPDSLDSAYREYRKRHNMLQPEEIRELRKRYDLTQAELARLLGFGSVTVARYENGALQDEAHDNALKLLNDPKIFHKLLNERPQAVTVEKFEKLVNKLNTLLVDQDLVENLFSYPPDISSGFREFSFDRCVSMILFLCRDGILKTKLNKLMFYADFKHFKDFTESISGLQYLHARYGPAPKHYDLLLATLTEMSMISTEEVAFGCDAAGEEVLGEEYRSLIQPDLSIFKDREIQTLLSVKKHFEAFGSKRIAEFSHKEPAYSRTKDGEEISCEYANQLQI